MRTTRYIKGGIPTCNLNDEMQPIFDGIYVFDQIEESVAWADLMERIDNRGMEVYRQMT